MKMKVKIVMLILMTVILLTAVSCGNSDSSQTFDLTQDREGNSIILPEKIDKIISIGPSNTELLVALGFTDKIIAADAWSGNIPGITADIAMLPSMEEIDNEFIIELQPDIIVVTGMSKAGGNNPLQVVEDTGICIIIIPSSSSINGIKEDIRYMAALMNVASKGEDIIKAFEQEIEDIKKIGETITEKKTVYFEISAAPWMYSFGKDTFLNEMIMLIGANNIFANQEISWMSVADEQILEANPDVILTSVNYLDDPIGEIKSRSGWSVITAIQNDEIYYIDTDSSNRPNHNIVTALKQMAKAIYPDKY